MKQEINLIIKKGLCALLFIFPVITSACNFSYKSYEIYLKKPSHKYALIFSFQEGCKAKDYLRMDLKSAKIKLLDENFKTLQEVDFSSGKFLESTKKIFLSGLQSTQNPSCLGKDQLVIDFRQGLIQSPSGKGMFLDLNDGESFNCNL